MSLEGYTESSRSKIEKNEMNTAGVMNPLLAFNTIVDTDVGLIRLIAMQYRDSSIFNLDYLNKDLTIKKLVQDLYNRENMNPLTICSDLKQEELNELYQDFMNTKYSEILKLSILTELFGMISIWKKYGGISTTILCSSQQEYEYLDFFLALKNVNKVVMEKGWRNNFPQYIFKSYDDKYINFITSQLVYNSTVYIANYKFNDVGEIKEGQEVSDSQLRIMKSDTYKKIQAGRSIIKMIDIYNKEKLYGGDKNDS